MPCYLAWPFPPYAFSIKSESSLAVEVHRPAGMCLRNFLLGSPLERGSVDEESSTNADCFEVSGPDNVTGHFLSAACGLSAGTRGRGQSSRMMESSSKGESVCR